MSAQNAAPTTKVSPSPSNINKSNAPTKPSGAEALSAATARHHQRVAGKGKFCSPTMANGLKCLYASASACEKRNANNNLRCVANPNVGRKF